MNKKNRNTNFAIGFKSIQSTIFAAVSVLVLCAVIVATFVSAEQTLLRCRKSLIIPFPDTPVSVLRSYSPRSQSPLPGLQKLASGKIPCGWR